MSTRHRTCYRKGDQLLNSYGARTNRFLLTNYGFAIRKNKYNSLGIKVFVNYDTDEIGEVRHQKILKLKPDKLAEDLLQYLRANLIFSYRKSHGSVQNNYHQDLLVSSPVNFDFEIYILKQGIGLVTNLLNNKFPTSIKEDLEILSQTDIPWRLYLAVTHRVTQKECLRSQEKLLTQLLSIVEDLQSGTTLKQAYLKQQPQDQTDIELIATRIRLRKYLRELNHYTQVQIQL